MKEKLLIFLILLIVIAGSLIDMTVLVYRISVIFTGFLLLCIIVLLAYATILGLEEIKKEWRIFYERKNKKVKATNKKSRSHKRGHRLSSSNKSSHTRRKR